MIDKIDKIDKDKLKSLIEESQLFTNRFGSFNKSDYEVLMFTVYLDSLTSPARDYEISIDLGITEQKVRSLRVKSQLLYPRVINWVEQMRQALENGSYDDGMITITLEDPSVRNRIRYEVESKSGTVNLSLNRKQLVLPVESFLILAACAEKDTDEVLQSLNKIFAGNEEIKGTIHKDKIGKRIFNGVTNIGEKLQAVLTVFTVGKPIIEQVIKLLGIN